MEKEKEIANTEKVNKILKKKLKSCANFFILIINRQYMSI
jgi:hypothetical protein